MKSQTKKKKQDCGCGRKKKEATTTGDVAGYSTPVGDKHRKTISELLKELEEILNKT